MIEELRKILKGEIEDSFDIVKEHSRDASIFEVRPQAVVFPKDADDVSALVKWAVGARKSGRNVSLTARAAGTDMSGGPLNESIVVSFTRHMNRIVEVDAKHAVVEPGVYYRDLEKEADLRGVFFPAYPASKHICAVGGMVANNAGGEKTLTYGKTDKYARSLRSVLADGREYEIKPLSDTELRFKIRQNDFEGTIYRQIFEVVEANREIIKRAKPMVSKNSAGYAIWDVWDGRIFDMTKLFVGSQGTLGMITQANLSLVPKKKHSNMLIVFVRDLAPLAKIVNEILRFNPDSVESYDDKTMRFAVRFFPDILTRMKGGAISLGIRFLPEFFMFLRGGAPKLFLMVEFAGDDMTELELKIAAAEEAMKKLGLQVKNLKEGQAEKYWVMRRESFNLMRNNIRGKRAVPFIDDVIVLPEKLPQFLPRLTAILDEYKDRIIYTVTGHVGDGNFHIIPLMDLTRAESRVLIPELANKVYKLVAEFGGSITAEHNDGLIRTPYLGTMFSPQILKIFNEIKNIFDPLGIFNPRKKVHADLDFALAHIIKY